MRAGSNWRHLNGLSLGMMGDPVRCLPKVVHPDVAALKLQHNRLPYSTHNVSTTGVDSSRLVLTVDGHQCRPHIREDVALGSSIDVTYGAHVRKPATMFLRCRTKKFRHVLRIMPERVVHPPPRRTGF